MMDADATFARRPKSRQAAGGCVDRDTAARLWWGAPLQGGADVAPVEKSLPRGRSARRKRSRPTSDEAADPLAGRLSRRPRRTARRPGASARAPGGGRRREPSRRPTTAAPTQRQDDPFRGRGRRAIAAWCVKTDASTANPNSAQLADPVVRAGCLPASLDLTDPRTTAAPGRRRARCRRRRRRRRHEVGVRGVRSVIAASHASPVAWSASPVTISGRRRSGRTARPRSGPRSSASASTAASARPPRAASFPARSGGTGSAGRSTRTCRRT